MNNPFVPSIDLNMVKDPSLQRSLSNLLAYFRAQGQLDGFQFLELIFTKAQANATISHNLGLTPTDILLTQLTGKGSVTFNFGLFTKTSLNISVSGACRVRFFFGVQGGNAPSTNAQSTDAQTYNPTG